MLDNHTIIIIAKILFLYCVFKSFVVYINLMDKLFLCFIFQWRTNTNDNLYFRFKLTFFIRVRSRSSWLQACLCLLWCFLSYRNHRSFLILCVSHLFWWNFCLSMFSGLVQSEMFHIFVEICCVIRQNIPSV